MSAWKFQILPDARGATLRVRHADAQAVQLRVDADVGAELPRFWYRLGRLVLASPELGLHHRMRTLLLCNDLSGAAELSGIDVEARLAPEVQRAALARGLVAAVLWLRACGRARPDAAVIAELPGVRDASGRSPFWDALGRHFYDGEPAAAAARFGPAWRTHVAALLPRETLLVPFLADEAQHALGVAASAAAQLSSGLTAAGLRDGDFVTLDDGGPVYDARLDTLEAWRDARQLDIRSATDAEPRLEAWMVASADGVAAVRGACTDGELRIDGDDLDALPLCRAGSTCWAVRVERMHPFGSR